MTATRINGIIRALEPCGVVGQGGLQAGYWQAGY